MSRIRQSNSYIWLQDWREEKRMRKRTVWAQALDPRGRVKAVSLQIAWLASLGEALCVVTEADKGGKAQNTRLVWGVLVCCRMSNLWYNFSDENPCLVESSYFSFFHSNDSFLNLPILKHSEKNSKQVAISINKHILMFSWMNCIMEASILANEDTFQYAFLLPVKHLNIRQ